MADRKARKALKVTLKLRETARRVARPIVTLLLLGGALMAWADQPADAPETVAPPERKLARTESPESAPDVAALSPEELQELADRVHEYALSLFRVQPITRVRTDYFTILTDLRQEQNIQTIAANLDSTFAVLHTVFGRDKPQEIEPIPVYVYHSWLDYLRLTLSLGAHPAIRGFYVPVFPLLVFQSQARSNQELAGIMIHEATHAYLSNFVQRGDVEVPLWVGEGLAMYVGNSEIRDGDLLLGTLRRKQDTIYGHAKSPAYEQLAHLRKALKKRKSPGLSEVLSADRSVFYGKHARTYYSAAWMFVHFLRHAVDEPERGRFLELIEKIRQGQESEAAVREVYGDLDALEEAFRLYVRRFER